MFVSTDPIFYLGYYKKENWKLINFKYQRISLISTGSQIVDKKPLVGIGSDRDIKYLLTVRKTFKRFFLYRLD